MHNRVLYRLTWLALVMSLGHHLDHLIRHNAFDDHRPGTPWVAVGHRDNRRNAASVYRSTE